MIIYINGEMIVLFGLDTFGTIFELREDRVWIETQPLSTMVNGVVSQSCHVIQEETEW